MNNNLSFSIKTIQHVSVFAALLITSIMLSGCSGLLHRLGLTRLQPPSPHTPMIACASAPVLIVNLEKAAHHRHYQLPDGRPCSEDNDNEQTQQS